MIKNFLDNLYAKRHSVLFMWVLSYAFVVVTAIFILTLSYHAGVNILRDEIIESSDYMLRQLQDDMDEIFSETDAAVRASLINPQVRQMSLSGPSLSAAERFTLSDISRSLLSYSNKLNTFLLYFEHIDEVVTLSGTLSSEICYKSYFGNIDIDYIDWKNIMTTDSQKALVPLNKKDGSGKVYLVISKIPFEITFGKSNTSFAFMIDEKILKNQAREIEQLGGGEIILTDRGNGVLSTARQLGNIFERLDENLADEDISGAFEKSGYIYSKVGSGILDVNYAFIIPQEVFWKKLSYMWAINNIGILIMLLFGGALTFYFVKRNYDPINLLIKTIKRHNKAGDDAEYLSEYDLISRSLSEIYGEKELLASKLESREVIIQRFFLSRLLFHEMDDEFPVYEAFEKYNIRFTGKYFSVVIFCVTDFRQLFSDENIDDGERNKLVELDLSVSIKPVSSTQRICLLTIKNQSAIFQARSDTSIFALLKESSKNITE